MTRIAESPRVLRLSERARARRKAPQLGPIDFSRPFIHEHFTPLYHTPAYRELGQDARLRYNQLAGIQFNEHFAAFEHGFTQRIMRGLARDGSLHARPELRRCIEVMLEEEAEHREMFLALNRLCLPEVYRDEVSYFTRLGRAERLAMRVATALPRHLMFLVWFVLLAEEFAVRVGRAMLKQPSTQSLGPLEPSFLRVHRAHLRDEARHVHVGAQAIRACLARASRVKRNVNAALYRPLLREIATPKRASVAVVERLVEELPALAPARARLLRAVRSPPAERAMFALMVGADGTPLTHELLRSFPEFRVARRERDD